ncbi:MAG: hypothetical protein K0M56_08395 [Kaistella sp.]|nr:hypothetical protein [Kaistella sp.]
MNNITLISTRHEKLGRCNSDELYKIIESLNPDVIFEEIPPRFFHEFYVYKSRRNLETDAIDAYITNHKIDQVPVDSDNIDPEEFIKNYSIVNKRIEGLADKIGFDYRSLIDLNNRLIATQGFAYLNSEKCIKIHRELNETIKTGLRKINNERLLQTNEVLKNTHEQRENKMLENIYTYGETHQYKNAIFTIGAGHRTSIIQKIPAFQKATQVKLKWSFYTH